jgi:hypothetical protein
MNTTISTTTRRIVMSAVAALALTALPQAGFAAGTEAGLWKVNPALSKSDSRSSRLVIDRVKATDGSAGTLVVISKGRVYLATPAASSSSGVQAVDYKAWNGMNLTQIGLGARAINHCGVDCRFGDVGDRLTVTFRNTGAGSEMMSNALALNR